MSVGACVICGGIIPAEWQVCPSCAGKFEPNAAIVNAMLTNTPVEYNGEKWGCISALIIRARSSHLRTHNKKRYTVQVELMSKNRHCVTIADPQEIKILERDET